MLSWVNVDACLEQIDVDENFKPFDAQGFQWVCDLI
jgi:hypothetical protein